MRILSPNFRRYYLRLAKSQSVLDLKQQIQVFHPSRARPANQRIEFRGEVLAEGTILGEVFPKWSETYEIHMSLRSPERNVPMAKRSLPRSAAELKVPAFSPPSNCPLTSTGAPS